MVNIWTDKKNAKKKLENAKINISWKTNKINKSLERLKTKRQNAQINSISIEGNITTDVPDMKIM